MQKVKVMVPGAGSYEVNGWIGPKEVFELLGNLMVRADWDVKKAVRGAPKKVKQVISEGAAGAPSPFTGITNSDGK